MRLVIANNDILAYDISDVKIPGNNQDSFIHWNIPEFVGEKQPGEIIRQPPGNISGCISRWSVAIQIG
jgi:hypothetical protein